MNEESDARSTGAGSGHEDGSSHMSGGEHMSGGGHMAGGSHMSGGKQMSGSGPLPGGAANGSEGAVPAPDDATDEGSARSGAGERRAIDTPEPETADRVTTSGAGLKGLWPMLTVVVALVVGVIIGYAVWG